MPHMVVRMKFCLASIEKECCGRLAAGGVNKKRAVVLIPFFMIVSIYILPDVPKSGISTLTSLVRLLEFHRACLSTLLYKSIPKGMIDLMLQ